MATFRFFENTPLKFSRVEDRRNTLQTEQNRPEYYYEYNGRLFQFLPAYFDNSEPLFFQFRTDYSDYTIYLKSISGSSSTLVKTLVNTVEVDSVTYNTYQVDVPVTGLTGQYYIRIEAIQPLYPILTFESEPFILETNSTKLKLSWFGSTSLNDPFVWISTRACMRIEAEVKSKLTGEDRTTYVDTFGNVENTYALPQNVRQLTVRNVPEYILRILEHAIQHDEFYINDVEFGTDAGFEYEAKANRTYSPTLKVRQKNYLNYSVDEQLTGELPILDPEYLEISDTEFLELNSTPDNLQIQ